MGVWGKGDCEHRRRQVLTGAVPQRRFGYFAAVGKVTPASLPRKIGKLIHILIKNVDKKYSVPTRGTEYLIGQIIPLPSP